MNNRKLPVCILKPKDLIESVLTFMNQPLAKAITEEFKGWNYKELSRKYRISEPYVRRIINNKKNSNI